MVMPRRTSLPVNHPYDVSHESEIFKTDFRSKAEAEAYFTALGDAGTLTFFGTEGVDYEFDTNDGFRSLTNSGGAKIIISDFVTGDEARYLYLGGATFDFQLKTEEWIEPAPPPSYDHPVTDMDGVDATTSGANGTYLFNFLQNTTNGVGYLRTLDDATTYQTKGRNKLAFVPAQTLGNPNVCSRPLSRTNKGTYIDARVTFHDGVGNMWFDQMTAVPPNGATVTTSTGERRTRKNSVNFFVGEHTTGEIAIFIGRVNAGTGSGTHRWVRNLRMFKTQTDLAVTPMLRRLISFGDSYSATSFGTAPTSPTDVSVGKAGEIGGYSASNHVYFADVDGALRFHQLITQSGFQVGGMYGGGQGGHYFSSGGANSLDDLGYKDVFINNYYPSMVFTFGLHNDTARVRDATITVATLQSELLANYLKPIMDTGCHGWGFVIPTISLSMSGTQAGIDAWIAVADMLIGLPDAFDAAYPEHAGKVKVIDARTEMGEDHANNPNWQHYWLAAEVTHPSKYGQQLFGEKCYQMAIEWMTGQ